MVINKGNLALQFYTLRKHMFFTSCTGKAIFIHEPLLLQERNAERAKDEKLTTEHIEHRRKMTPARTEERGFAVSIKEVPVTVERRPFIPTEGDDALKDPGTTVQCHSTSTALTQPTGTARANQAADVQHPHGTQKNNYARDHKDQTVLQQHLAFFDRDSDGVIYPFDTYIGFHRLGYGILLSLLSVIIIHANFSYPTIPGYLPDPRFPIYVARIYKDKHGSDSGTYDTEGRFVPQKFEDIFAKYAGDRKSLTFGELLGYLKGQRLVMDPFGWGGAIFECEFASTFRNSCLCSWWTNRFAGMATWILIAREGRIHKEDIRGIYDGSIFYEIAARREKQKQ